MLKMISKAQKLTFLDCNKVAHLLTMPKSNNATFSPVNGMAIWGVPWPGNLSTKLRTHHWQMSRFWDGPEGNKMGALLAKGHNRAQIAGLRG